MSNELVCPGCGNLPAGDEAFCARCGMPLVAAIALGGASTALIAWLLQG